MNSSQHKRRYNWIPDLPDPRDYLFSTVRPVAKLKKRIPSQVDLRSQCSPVEDQGHIGSCTANALVGALEFLELKENDPFVEFSRLFIYYNERALNGNINQDSGASLRDGIKVLNQLGACSEGVWPYRQSLVFKKPTAKAYKQALDHQILTYHRLSALDEMRVCLSLGYPFVFGFSVFSGFESREVAQSGILNMPKSEESFLGGHAVMAIGYDDSTKRLLVRNSWGNRWGMQGYFTMPYAYVESGRLSDDFWTISKVEE